MDAALSWNWFDFGGAVRVVRRGGRVPIVDVSEGGGERVWGVAVDGRVIGFKFLRRGVGRPLLILMHGMGLSVASFRGVSSFLLETHDLALVDYSAVSWDGGGWTREGVAVRVMAKAVWAVADAVGAERVSLGGNSLGGGMCLVAALERPGRAERMVLSNPACYPQALPRMYRWARVPVLGEVLMAVTEGDRFVTGIEYIGYVNKIRFDPELRRRYLGQMRVLRNRWRLMGMIRQLPANEKDVTGVMHLGELRKIEVPTLVTWGERDPLLTEGAGKRLARELGCGVYAGFAELAHMPHEEAPEVVGRLWARFLNDR